MTSPTISTTLPTVPSFSRTFIPWGWVAEFVRISATMPRVLLPVRWSCFLTTSTVEPTRTEDRSLPSPFTYSILSRISAASRTSFGHRVAKTFASFASLYWSSCERSYPMSSVHITEPFLAVNSAMNLFERA